MTRTLTNLRKLLAHYRRWGWVWVLCVATLVLFHQRFEIGVNCTPSLPGHVFLIDKADKTVERNAFVAFTWEGAPPIPDGLTAVKIAVGLPGDRVDVTDGEVRINGEFLCWAKPFSRTGEALLATESLIVPADHVFVYAPHPDSYDSRYAIVGVIHFDRLVGRAREIF